MRRFFALILTLLLIACAACAKQITKLPPESFDDVRNGSFDVGFGFADVGKDSMKVDLCAEERYSAKDVESLKPGDSVVTSYGVVKVRSMEVSEFGAFVNDGSMSTKGDGIQFFPLGADSYCILDDERTFYETVESVEYRYADKVTFSCWSDEAADMISVTVPASDVKNVLNAFGESINAPAYIEPARASIDVKDGRITDITIICDP